jgi:prepilin-type N-terminal cleavage/methylation domain-containing protein
MQNQKKGFTLLEVLLVIALIGILLTIILVVLNPQTRFESARNDIRQSDIQKLEGALTQYRLQEGAYPPGLDGTLREICDPDASSCSGFINLSVLVPTYIQSIPQDPQDTDSIGGSGYSMAVDIVRNLVAVKAIQAESSATIAINDPLPAGLPVIATNTPLLDVPTLIRIEYLIVAGGGGGGYGRGGGGGAGGLLTGIRDDITTGTYPIVVGSGGASFTNGSNSTALGLTASGGGRGGGHIASFANGNTTEAGASGGSGGGGSMNYGSLSMLGGSGVFGQGNTGGTGTNGGVDGPRNTGGGGGAGAVGVTGSGLTIVPDGGIGIASSITGVSTYYAGGGGGARGGTDYSSAGSGIGGLGGGGNGGGAAAATNGTVNTGGGGGGSEIATGGLGGSGIVIIRYRTDGSDGVSPLSTGGTKTTSGLYTIHTFTTDGTFVAIKN